MDSRERGMISNQDLRNPIVRVVYTVMVAALAGLAVTMIYPFLTTIFNAFKSKRDIFTFPPKLLPQEWVWTNFAEGWKFISFGKYFLNTMYIFGGTMFFSILFIGMASFSLAHLYVPYRKGFTLFFMCTLLIPGSTYMIPNYLNLKELGLINTYWALWLPAAANAFWILLLKNFFDELNKELFEAARIDGASELRCFLQLAIPLSMPIVSTLFIFGFTHVWNEWFWTGILLSDADKYPIATAVYKYVISGENNSIGVNVQFGVLTIVMLPPLLVFILLQKQIIRGVNLSGVKG